MPTTSLYNSGKRLSFLGVSSGRILLAPRELAATLMQEEFNELISAATPLEELDAFCDLLYVTAGAMHSVGYERSLILTPFTNENYTARSPSRSN